MIGSRQVLRHCIHSTAQMHTPAQLSTAQHSTARHGTARHSTARHSTARHGTAQHNTALKYSPAQPDAAQHSTAWHGTAQHSTARHSRRGALVEVCTYASLSMGACVCGWAGWAAFLWHSLVYRALMTVLACITALCKPKVCQHC